MADDLFNFPELSRGQMRFIRICCACYSLVGLFIGWIIWG